MEDFQRVSRRRPVGNDGGVDVPDSGKVANVVVIVPIAECGKVTVSAGLPRVLRGWLSIHLQDAATGTANHSANQIDVIHLHGGRGRLHRLVDTLQAS